jgi:hypothetical protein
VKEPTGDAMSSLSEPFVIPASTKEQIRNQPQPQPQEHSMEHSGQKA